MAQVAASFLVAYIIIANIIEQGRSKLLFTNSRPRSLHSIQTALLPSVSSELAFHGLRYITSMQDPATGMRYAVDVIRGNFLSETMKIRLVV